MTTCTTCPYCGVGCGVIASADGMIKGDPNHPANFGLLCSKGSALGETIGLDGRLLKPRIHGSDVAWDTALDLVASQFSKAIAEHGPDSVAFYVSGQLLTEDYYVANKLMKGYIGSANIDTNSRLCMASSVAGHKRAFGSDTVPGSYEDLEDADLLVLVGSNLAWCHPVLHQRVMAAKAARPNMRIINIDPRRTASSEVADMHLGVAPDGDVALFNGLLAYLAKTDKIDFDYVNQHVEGFAEALSAAQATNPSDSGLNDFDLAQFYRAWADTEKVVTIYSQGVNQSRCGTDKVNAILNCHLATGRIGRKGMGPFSVTGQPNAMGGRETGGLANMLANHLDLDNPGHRDAMQAEWSSPVMASKPGLKAVDLFEACASGDIKALWVMSTNPAVSLPDANGVAEAIKAVPFVVVSDILEHTDTGDLADVLLPAAAWGEKNGTVTNSERRISRQRAFLPVPGEARPDWQIICDVAKRMGWSDAFDFASPGDVFDEYVCSTAVSRDFGRDLDLTGLAGLTEEAYEAFEPIQWPVPYGAPPGGRFFEDGGFFHLDGKARMLPLSAPELLDNTGFIFNTGRIRDQWHTMTRTGRAPRLGHHLAEPYVEVHPNDAQTLGVAPADLMQVTSDLGTGIFRVLMTERVQRGHLFAPMHWTRQLATSSLANAPVAALTDPISGQPALKGSRVSAERFNAAWYGFVASDQLLEPKSDYAAVSRMATGWKAEIAGRTALDQPRELFLDLIGSQAGEVGQFYDPKTQLMRFALFDEGLLRAVFFLGPRPVALGRAHVASLIGSEVSLMDALSGRPGGNVEDVGAIVCSCMSVGSNALQRAILDGACSVDELGQATGAGTNCGSCKPELAALLGQMKQPLAAE